jgi:NADH dehydrogenase FAD-containing subunit
VRLTRPAEWARDYLVPFDRYRGLDRVRSVQATLTRVDFAARIVYGHRPDGTEVAEPYDALVISTGVSNGFWRRPAMQSPAQIREEIAADHERLARWSSKRVDLYFPHDRPLVEHHRKTWEHLRRRLIRLGVGLHPGYRAEVPNGFDCDAITADPVRWSTGQPPSQADAVVWAIGRSRPNTDWLPAELLDEDGFVKVTPELRVPGYRGVFAIGDVAATDPLRSSARNRADAVLAHNIRAEPAGRPLRSYRAPRRRWGSVIGIQSDGVEVFAPNGRPFRIPAWSVHRVLMPWIVRRGIYRGIRPNQPMG